MKKALFLSCLAAATGLLTTPAWAQSANLTDWAKLGDAVVTAGSASLSTAFNDESPASGTGALDYLAFEPALGLAYDSLGGDSFDGSALRHSFKALAHTTLRFNWSLSTDSFDPAYADRAFVALDGQVLVLGSVATGAVSGSFSHSFAAGGSHDLAFGVVDVNDVLGVSTLTVDGVSVTAVPEPLSAALLLAGLGGLAVAARRRRD